MGNTFHHLCWFGLAFATHVALGAEAPTPFPACLGVEEVRDSERVPEVELLARLVFAEGVSTRFQEVGACRGDASKILDGIAWGVMNRVRLGQSDPRMAKRYGRGIRGVVFKPGQFNPAVSKRSRFSKVFACPGSYASGEKLWALAMDSARKATDHPELNPMHARVVNFYYPYSEQAAPVPPRWAQTGSREFERVSFASECVWFFRLR